MKLAVTLITLSLIAIFGQVYAPAPVGPGHTYIAREMVPNAANVFVPTGYYKVGGTGDTAARRRTKLNTGNPRHIHMLVFTAVAQTRNAETAARNDVNLAHWRVNLGGGTEWYFVPPNQWNNFFNAYMNAINPFLNG